MYVPHLSLLAQSVGSSIHWLKILSLDSMIKNNWGVLLQRKMWLSSLLISSNEFRGKFSPLCFEGCCCHNTILFPTNPSSQGRWNSCHKSSHSDLGSEKGYFLLRLEMSAVVTRKLYKHHHLEFYRENLLYSVTTFINFLTVSVWRRQLTIYLWHDWQNSLGFCQKNLKKKNIGQIFFDLALLPQQSLFFNYNQSLCVWYCCGIPMNES